MGVHQWFDLDAEGHEITQILPTMVKVASGWIKAGLPLRCLKIVLYSSDPTKLTEKDKECFEIFAKVKEEIMDQEKMKAVSTNNFDVCLSFHEDDSDLAKAVVQTLHEQYSELSIHSNPFVFNPGDIWQDDICQVMKNSKIVIPLLTPSYIGNGECLEQFSIALCCNRLKKAETVMPFYMKTCEPLPAYVSLVQYIECRSNNPSDDFMLFVKNATKRVVDSLSNDETTDSSQETTDTKATVRLKSYIETRGKKYDIFISYCHKDKDDPVELDRILRSRNPDWHVFLDTEELKPGNLWQQTLYDAIENSFCMVSFLTQGYLSSTVCNEEFNIATARHFCKDNFLLFPIHTGLIDKVPKHFSHLPCVDLTTETNRLEKFAWKIEQMVNEVKHTQKAPKIECVKSLMEKLRKKQFEEKFHFEGGNVVRNTTRGRDFNMTDNCNQKLCLSKGLRTSALMMPIFPTSTPSSSTTQFGSVMFLCADDCLNLAAIMSEIMKKLSPELVTHLQPFNKLHRPEHLKSAEMVVVFVSDQLISTETLLEELHTVLCRQRGVKDSNMYLIESSLKPIKPCYLHSLPYSLCIDDNFWKRLERKRGNRTTPAYTVKAEGMEGSYQCKAFQNLALTAASHDVIYQMSLKGSGSSLPCNVVNMAQVENELKGIKDGLVPVNENIISLSKVSHTMSRIRFKSTPFLRLADVSYSKAVPTTSKEHVEGEDRTKFQPIDNEDKEDNFEPITPMAVEKDELPLLRRKGRMKSKTCQVI